MRYSERQGSSPRVRGRRRLLRILKLLRRLIPAGAGQTSLHSGSRLRLRGSSPRVRGRPSTLTARLRETGLIPAGAGQTSAGCGTRRSSRAHPRGCGADSSHRPLANPVGGSSPQVRGRLAGPQDRWGGGGLIPAGAGQTLPPILPGCVHSSGSSPRVRGRRGGRRGDRGGLGLIPAGAGQTNDELAARRSNTAHPRGCGADFALFFRFDASLGSSPRVRGRQLQQFAGFHRPRLIPAGAGQTRRTRPSRSRMTAHPRGCGADLPLAHLLSGVNGSSPRVRGRPALR